MFAGWLWRSRRGGVELEQGKEERMLQAKWRIYDVERMADWQLQIRIGKGFKRNADKENVSVRFGCQVGVHVRFVRAEFRTSALCHSLDAGRPP